jgi:transposase
MSYDRKFRERVLGYVDAGKTQEEVRKMFGLGINTITEWKKLREETGSLENRPLERAHRKIDPEKLLADVKLYPDAFNRDRAVRFNCTESGIEKAMKKLKVTRKKRVSDTKSATKKKASGVPEADCESSRVQTLLRR